MAQQSVYHSDISMGMSRGENSGDYHFDRNMTRNPENIVTIFTVNTRQQFSASGGVMFAGRAKNERYRKVASISDPKYYVDDLSIEGNKNQKKVTADDGKWVAMDWLNPENVFSLDQNYVVPNQVDYSTNLLVRGLFFIVRPYDPVNGNMDDKPTEEEAKSAEDRLRERYTQLTRLYQTTNSSAPARLPLILNEEMIDALNFAGLKTPHNTALEAKTECPTCGEVIKAGLKFHRSESLGVICIEPSETGWRAAVASGIKSKEDVPEEFRWSNPVGRPRAS
jgi:hypothetical protein